MSATETTSPASIITAPESAPIKAKSDKTTLSDMLSFFADSFLPSFGARNGNSAEAWSAWTGDKSAPTLSIKTDSGSGKPLYSVVQTMRSDNQPNVTWLGPVAGKGVLIEKMRDFAAGAAFKQQCD